MKLGVFGLNKKAGASRGATERLAARCESLGYDSWWVGEHVAVPSPRPASVTMEPTDSLLEPLVNLSFVSAVTETMLVASGIVILPQRQPVLLAKQAASLDALSGGRFVLGVGVGHTPSEMAALGVQMSERGARMDEYLSVLRTLWYEEAPLSHEGRFVSFSGLDAHPRPVSSIPIVVGGRTAPAFRRAVEQGNGWYGFNYGPEAVADVVRQFTSLADEGGRPEGLGRLEINVTPSEPLTTALVDAYASVGVDRLIAHPVPVEDEQAIVRFLGHTAETVLG